VNIENENLFKDSLSNGINLFLGSGFSVLATGTFEGDLATLPVGDGLRREMLKAFHRDEKSQMSLAQLCQVISTTQREALDEFLRIRFTVTSFDDAYRNLERVNIKSIFTTNVDNLVYRIFEDSKAYFINDISLRGPAIAGSSAIDYIALHGSVVHQKTEGMDFSPVEISSSFERDKDKWYGYVNRVQQVPTLYWGYSMSDAGVLQTFSKETNNGRDRAACWVTLRSEDAEAIEYYSSLGFQIIVAETSELLNYFSHQKIKKSSNKKVKIVDQRFSEYIIPAVSKVPVRSLTEFYLGSEPTWYDIFLGNLHKTKYFNSVRDAIAGGENCLLIGAAVTGKSTLLRMLANGVSDNSHPLFIDEITPEKARLLVNDIEVEGVSAIAFVDNAADAWEAINILDRSENIQVVAAERDYIFDSVAHRFPRGRYKAFDVSGLSAIDVQAVLDKIPPGIQRADFSSERGPLHVDFDPTFFEVFDKRVSGHFLADRFIDALRELKRKAPAKHDLLLLSCYLYSCRVPTSVDVASSFLAGMIDDPFAVYELLESMGTLLSRYEGSLAESAQAYFVPRSRAVAEAVMKRVVAEDLRNLLVRFHASVSPTKIPRYDIFRRMAYDANLTNRAFPEWEGGLEFYNRCFARDKSHSFKQQGAIYLSRKKQYPLAFQWIDEAMSMAGKRSASVRNTYAVIIFNANYDKSATAPEVIASLDESMEILQQCYADDLRKVYHAKVFADQAVKYAGKFPQSDCSLEYIEKAIAWLEAELKARQGDRSINQLLRSLRGVRRSLTK